MMTKNKTYLRLIVIFVALAILLTCGIAIVYAANTPTRIVAANLHEQTIALADEVKNNTKETRHPAIIVVDNKDDVNLAAGSYLSVQKKAPIIYVEQNNIESIVRFVQTNLETKGTLYFLGAETPLTAELTSLLPDVKTKRLNDSDVVSTNLKILKTAKIDKDLIVCSLHNYSDIMVASIAGKPVLFVEDTLTTAQKIFLFFKKPNFVVVDSNHTINDTVRAELSSYGTVTDIEGDSLYDTATRLAEYFYSDATSAIVFHGNSILEASATALLSNVTNSPVLMARTCLETAAEKYTQQRNITTGYVIGHENVLTNTTVNTLFSFNEPVGHEFTTDTFAATCTWYGFDHTYCKHCGMQKELVKLSPIEHDYNILQTVEVSTGWDGYEIGKCKDCAQVDTINVVPKLNADEWPKGYQDETAKITIYKEWYGNAYVYAAHLEFTDYSRLTTDGAYGKNNVGRERVSDAAERVGAIFMVNGDWAVPGNMANYYAIARNGVVFAHGIIECMGVYNNQTGILTSPSALGIRGRNINSVVKEGIITDTFQFADAFLVDGTILTSKASTSRAQRTFIGTNGNPGDIWICVSDGRMNDGESAGLTGYQCASFLKDKGCVFGIPLDGGGSSTIWFQGEVLNAAKKGQRAVADMLYFK